MTTLLITNGLIIDGSGRDPYIGHVLVRGDNIAAVVRSDTAQAETLLAQGADRCLDATGLAVSPGFIDAHNHFDWVVPLPEHDNILFPLVEQGVTTVITGNCGFSPHPSTQEMRRDSTFSPNSFSSGSWSAHGVEWTSSCKIWPRARCSSTMFNSLDMVPPISVPLAM